MGGVQPGIWVKTVRAVDDKGHEGDTFVLARSAARSLKVTSMRVKKIRGAMKTLFAIDARTGRVKHGPPALPKPRQQAKFSGLTRETDLIPFYQCYKNIQKIMRVYLSILIGIVAVAMVVFFCFHRRPKSVEVVPETSVAKPAEEKAPAAKPVSAVAEPSVPRGAGERNGAEPDAAGESWDSGSVGVHSQAEEDAGVEADAGMVDSVALSDREGWRPPAVDAATMGAFREAFARWRNSGRDEKSTADLRLALEGMSKEAVLASAATLMRAGTEQDRMDALWAISNGFGVVPGEEEEVGVNIPEAGEDALFPEGGESEWNTGDRADDWAPEDAEETERKAAETHDVVAIVSAGLEDASAEVRQVAYEAVAALSQERADVLYSQLLCSDSPVSEDLRRQLMEELEGADDPGALTLFMQAMQSPDAETAAAAKRNLEAIAGREFEDALAAAEWLEAKEREDADADTGDAWDVKNKMNGASSAEIMPEGEEQP